MANEVEDFAVVAHGLPPDTQQAIVEQLKRADVLIVCGYGGRDFFDVDPFFMNHAAFDTDDAINLSCLRVLWLSHGQFHESRDEPFVPGTPAVGRAMLEALTRCGASPSGSRTSPCIGNSPVAGSCVS